MPECECTKWCDVNTRHRILTGHHENCCASPSALEKALDLVAKLAHGMDCWAADEDGIHPDAWEAYKQAKLLEGEVVADDRAA